MTSTTMAASFPFSSDTIRCRFCRKDRRLSDLHLELCAKHVEKKEGGRLVEIWLQVGDSRLKSKTFKEFQFFRRDYPMFFQKTLTAMKNAADLDTIGIGIRLAEEDTNMWTHCKRNDGEVRHSIQKIFKLEEFLPCKCTHSLPRVMEWQLTNCSDTTPGDAFECDVDVGFIKMPADDTSFQTYLAQPKHQTFHVRVLKCQEKNYGFRRHRRENVNSQCDVKLSDESAKTTDECQRACVSLPERLNYDEVFFKRANSTCNIGESVHGSEENPRISVHIEHVKHVNIYTGETKTSRADNLGTQADAGATITTPEDSGNVEGKSVELVFDDDYYSHPYRRSAYVPDNERSIPVLRSDKTVFSHDFSYQDAVKVVTEDVTATTILLPRTAVQPEISDTYSVDAANDTLNASHANRDSPFKLPVQVSHSDQKHVSTEADLTAAPETCSDYLVCTHRQPEPLFSVDEERSCSLLTHEQLLSSEQNLSETTFSSRNRALSIDEEHFGGQTEEELDAKSMTCHTSCTEKHTPDYNAKNIEMPFGGKDVLVLSKRRDSKK